MTRTLRLSWGSTNRLVLLGDSLAGRRDGRRGLPVVAADATSGTPRLDEIHRTSDAHLDRIRRAVIADSAVDLAHDVELAEHVLPRAQERLAEAERRLERVRGAGVASGRRQGEQTLTDDLVARRREDEADRRIARALKRVEDERTEVRKARADLAATRRRLAHRAHEAHAEAEQVHAWASRRATHYLHAAQRRHPDRAAFAATYPTLLPPSPTREQWWSAIQLETS